MTDYIIIALLVIIALDTQLGRILTNRITNSLRGVKHFLGRIYIKIKESRR